MSEEKLVDYLKDLAKNYCIKGVKAEFAQEGASFDEGLKLKKIAHLANLEFTIKIGGAEAIRDLADAKKIGANSIVAPMIESCYAAKKYFDAIDTVFSKEEKSKIKFFINIETICGFNCLEEILKGEFSKNLSGIVFGRTDMTGSLGLSSNEVNNNKILNYAKEISKLCAKYNKKFIVGGSVCTNSLPFFKNLANLDFFETRKIIFDAKILEQKNAQEGIFKAVDFELLWIKNKENFGSSTTLADEKRIEILQNRTKEIL